MRSLPITITLALLPLLGASCASTPQAGAEHLAQSTYSHDVFFRLADPADAAGLMEACERLREIPVVVHLVVGTRDASQVREVNEDWFQVALHVEFDSAEAYAGYGPHPVHQELLAEYGEGFEKVAVYDSLIRD